MKRAAAAISVLPAPWLFRAGRISAQSERANRWRLERGAGGDLTLSSRRTGHRVAIPRRAVHSLERASVKLNVQIVLNGSDATLAPLPRNYWQAEAT